MHVWISSDSCFDFSDIFFSTSLLFCFSCSFQMLNIQRFSMHLKCTKYTGTWAWVLQWTWACELSNEFCIYYKLKKKHRILLHHLLQFVNYFSFYFPAHHNAVYAALDALVRCCSFQQSSFKFNVMVCLA